jgi:hypothetical protein
MKTLLCPLILAMYMTAMAQKTPCPPKPEEAPGAWSLESRNDFRYDALIVKVAKSRQANMLAQRDSVLRLIRQACPPLTGFKATLLAINVVPSVVDSSFIAYDHYTHYNPFICSRGNLTAVESLTNFRIGVNSLDQENFIRHQFAFDAIGENLYTIPPRAGTIQGNDAYRISNISTAERYGLIITRKGAVPFTPVTMREFYSLQEKLIRFTQAKLKADVTSSTRIRPEKDLRAELQAEMDEIDRSSLGQDAKNSRKRRLQEDFRTDEQLLQEKLQAIDKQYDGYVNTVEELESRFRSDLDKPMYIREYEYSMAILGNENRFFNDPDKGYMVVRMNPGYFLKTAAKWQPQFMLLTWRKEVDAKYSLLLDEAWRQKLDMQALEKMIVH